MRSAGLPIEVLSEYVSLFKQGDETLAARKELLVGQQKLLIKKMEDMKETIERLNYKIGHYENIMLEKENLLKKTDK
jgi:DNA-binding transcriptional MerR regulator